MKFRDLIILEQEQPKNRFQETKKIVLGYIVLLKRAILQGKYKYDLVELNDGKKDGVVIIWIPNEDGGEIVYRFDFDYDNTEDVDYEPVINLIDGYLYITKNKENEEDVYVYHGTDFTDFLNDENKLTKEIEKEIYHIELDNQGETRDYNRNEYEINDER
jgi:hypothetical protein